MSTQARAASGASTAFAAQHCPLVSGVETAPLRGGGSFSCVAWTDLFSPPGHKPQESCPPRPQESLPALLKAFQPRPEALTTPKRPRGWAA